MRTRIGTQIVLAVALVTALTIALIAATIVPAHRAELIAQLTRSADQLAETVKNSTLDAMLENRRDRLHRQIAAIGHEEGIDRVRLFNKEGRIMFSSDPDEIGRALDKKAEACYACHAENRPLQKPPVAARARIFRDAEGHRVLGIVHPIQNQPACSSAACHAHSPQQAVLGVLDVTMPLTEVDRQIARSEGRMVGLAALAILASGLLLTWMHRRLVVRPVRALAVATHRVSEGDLAITVPVPASRELGDLASAFNTMTQRLSEARLQLAQADKLASIGRLAAGVAHEINNPLTGVLTYSSLLLKRTPEGSETRDDLEVIVRETKRCRDIVKGLLDFARRTPPRRQPADLNDVVRRSAAVVMNQLTLNRVAVSFDLAPELPPVPADPNQMQQVLVNLLLNAADAIGEAGGAIRVSTRRGGRERPAVELVVEDDGRGIPPEAMAHLFEPFFTTKGTRGTGLGLAITWGIVQAHGGTIEVHSEVGRGSRFTVLLPLKEADSAPVAAA